MPAKSSPPRPAKATSKAASKPAAKASSAASTATLILLVRHGQTPTTGTKLPGRAKGLQLSDIGREQAAAAAAQIQSLAPVAAVYASPLERTQETASFIAKSFGLRVRSNRGLIECDFGEWTGEDLKTLMKKPEWATVQRSPSTWRFPGGESFTEMQLRITEALHALHRRHPGETIVAVSHADPIKGAIAAAVGTHIDLFQRINVSPCSVSAIRYDVEGPAVLTVNATADLRTLVGGHGPTPDGAVEQDGAGQKARTRAKSGSR